MSGPTPEKTTALVSLVTAANLFGVPITQINTWIDAGRLTIIVIRKNTYVCLDDVERLMREGKHEQP